MQKHTSLTEQRLRIFGNRLRETIYSDLRPLSAEYIPSHEPLTFDQFSNNDFRSIKVGEQWGERFDCAWFRFCGTIPAQMNGSHVVVLLDVGGEGCVFDDSGTPVQGITNVGSMSWNPHCGKRQVSITPRAKGGEKIKLLVDAGANSLLGAFSGENLDVPLIARLKQADLAIFNPTAWKLQQDFDFLLNLMFSLNELSRHRKVLMYTLNEVANCYQDGNPEAVQVCLNLLKKELIKKANASALHVTAIGHAHTDIAWLWPLRETLRKIARTFSTALRMMQEYPDYKFGASQPYLYELVKQHYPALYKKIKKAVQNKRWECQGAMWVEADCNLTGGESLVRQLTYGKRFFRSEFGVDVDNLWLPDVFGYSGSMPQLLRLAGVEYFCTQKLSWSQFNPFPHNTIRWRGIDGTTILTHFPPNNTYNASGLPDDLQKFETNNSDADRCDHALCLFGVGDGGGGPGREHIERMLRAKNMEDLPRVTMQFAREYFHSVKRKERDLIEWDGELYLEYHRGTYTTQAWIKRLNRKMEILLREVEFYYALYRKAYPRNELDFCWKTLLLNQFHDIIPGSSIRRVYDEAKKQFEQIHTCLEALLSDGESQFLQKAKNTGKMNSNTWLIRNSLSWRRNEVVLLPDNYSQVTNVKGEELISQAVVENGKAGTLVLLSAPSCGHTTVHAQRGKNKQNKRFVMKTNLCAGESYLENTWLRLEFDKHGGLKSVYDKEFSREVLAGTANKFRLYEDRPNMYDAWDVDAFYLETTPTSPELKSMRLIESGLVRATLELEFYAQNYSVRQRISLYAHSRRIDFQTKINWQEEHKFLRVEFPVAIRATEASYEIQFGHIFRPTHANTSWDMARFEVCAHKWGDISQADYGVALLNDSKYGYRIYDNVVSLSLLRAPCSPDRTADRGEHEFTYSLFPHSGRLSESVVREGYALNIPMRAVKADELDSRIAVEYSAIQVDTPGVVVESVKSAEDNNDVIVRIYEALGGNATAILNFGFPILSAAEVNLLEENQKTITMQNSEIVLQFRPFEIKTLQLRKGD